METWTASKHRSRFLFWNYSRVLLATDNDGDRVKSNWQQKVDTLLLGFTARDTAGSSQMDVRVSIYL